MHVGEVTGRRSWFNLKFMEMFIKGNKQFQCARCGIVSRFPIRKS
jgi:hypothetical protein